MDYSKWDESCWTGEYNNVTYVNRCYQIDIQWNCASETLSLWHRHQLVILSTNSSIPTHIHTLPSSYIVIMSHKVNIKKFT